LRYSRLKANGAQSVLYDVVTLTDAARRGNDAVLLLGVSGALILPFIRLLSPMRIVTNVDGIEWRRDKWKGLARRFLRLSEWAAVRFSHQIVADNQGIADYLRESYGVEVAVIAYGGDHALEVGKEALPNSPVRTLPADYALALCRIEPENNVDLILQAFSSVPKPLVFVGNWNGSSYGRTLKASYDSVQGIHLLDPIYEPGDLHRLRSGASLYVHGHSAGGTNPSLVEMMHFGVPILAFDCAYNRFTTENMAQYFLSVEGLRNLALQNHYVNGGEAMLKIARKRYLWSTIGDKYFDIIFSRADVT
jgi:glycosyltransferase involved in cell wall biosynthesis